VFDPAAEPSSFVLSPLIVTLVAVAAAAAFAGRRLYVTDVSMPLRPPWPVDLGNSVETDDALEVDADFFPPKQHNQFAEFGGQTLMQINSGS